MNNWGLKLLSLVIATVMALLVNYFFVYNESETSVRQVIVPIEVKNVPADKMIIWPPVRQAEVTIQGPSLFVARIASAPPVFVINIPPEAKQRYVAPLTRESLSIPKFVEILSIKPPEVEFTLDLKVSRSLPVVVPKVGTLPEDLRLDELTVEPQRVEVRGPETEVKVMKSIETYPLDLAQISENSQREVDIRLPGNLSEVEPKKAIVTLRVSHLKSEERFPNLPVEVRSLGAEGFVVEPSSVAVKVNGPRDIVRGLKPEEIIPYVRVGPGSASRQNVGLEVEVPRGVTVAAIEPDKVDVIRLTKPVKEPASGKASGSSVRSSAAK